MSGGCVGSVKPVFRSEIILLAQQPGPVPRIALDRRLAQSPTAEGGGCRFSNSARPEVS